MADILTFKRKTPAEKHRGKSLCRSGFHKWTIVTERKFDVKQGRLVTVYQCSRCARQKVTAIQGTSDLIRGSLARKRDGLMEVLAESPDFLLFLQNFRC